MWLTSLHQWQVADLVARAVNVVVARAREVCVLKMGAQSIASSSASH